MSLMSNHSSNALTSAIFDAEIVAVDKVGADRKILPFQQLSTRPQDSTVSAASSSSAPVVKIAVIVFDLIYLNGESLTEMELPCRRSTLQKILKETPGEVEFAHGSTLDVPIENPGIVEEEVSRKLKEAVAGATEGLMVKMLSRRPAIPPSVKEFVEVLEEDEFGFPVSVRKEVTSIKPEVIDASEADTNSTSCEHLPSNPRKHPPMVMTEPVYEAGRRSDVWRKLKVDYLDGTSICDSIDVVPIGAWRGSGRKAAWYSPILVAVYDPDEGTFQSLCRVMSGFTDDSYKKIAKAAKDWIVESKPTNVVTGEECRVWFQPSVVWEIRGADLTVSPKHMASIGIHSGDSVDIKGLGLRFPRFRHFRPDKVPTQATTSYQISEFFQNAETVAIESKSVHSYFCVRRSRNTGISSLSVSTPAWNMLRYTRLILYI